MRVNREDDTIIDDSGAVIISNIKATSVVQAGNVLMMRFGAHFAAYNLNGNSIVSFINKCSSMYITKNLVAYKKENRKWTVLNNNGEEILKGNYSKILFTEKLILAKRGSYLYIYLHDGEEVTKIKSINFEINKEIVFVIVNEKDKKYKYKLCKESCVIDQKSKKRKNNI